VNRTEHLLICLVEECNEVACRATKALRFGIDEVQPEQELTNGERIIGELNDLLGVIELLSLPSYGNRLTIQAKKKKVLRFMDYARSQRALEQP